MYSIWSPTPNSEAANEHNIFYLNNNSCLALIKVGSVFRLQKTFVYIISEVLFWN